MGFQAIFSWGKETKPGWNQCWSPCLFKAVRGSLSPEEARGRALSLQCLSSSSFSLTLSAFVSLCLSTCFCLLSLIAFCLVAFVFPFFLTICCQSFFPFCYSLLNYPVNEVFKIFVCQSKASFWRTIPASFNVLRCLEQLLYRLGYSDHF